MYFMSGDTFQLDQSSRFPCSCNVEIVKGYTRETIDQAHVQEIGNLYESGGGVGPEVYELDETIVLNRKDTISGLDVNGGGRRGGGREPTISFTITRVTNFGGAYLLGSRRAPFARRRMCR